MFLLKLLLQIVLQHRLNHYLYNYVSSDNTPIKATTSEQVAAGTMKTFSTSTAPSIPGYIISSVRPTNATINSDTTVTYTYEVESAAIELETVTVNGGSPAQGDFALVVSGGSYKLHKYTPIYNDDASASAVTWVYGTLAASYLEGAENDKIAFTKESDGTLTAGEALTGEFLLDSTHILIFRNNSSEMKLTYSTDAANENQPFRLQAMNVNNLIVNSTYMKKFAYGGTYEYEILS